MGCGKDDCGLGCSGQYCTCICHKNSCDCLTVGKVSTLYYNEDKLLRIIELLEKIVKLLEE
jgi:hypothetical protein